jgi:endo-1,4-beta-xylanase
MAVATEAAVLGDGVDGVARRRRTLARIRDRVAARWRVGGCVGALDVATATDGVLALAAGAAGDGTTRGLRALAGEAGRAVGAAVEPDEVAADADYAAIVPHDLTSLTAENAMKWQPVHPEPDVWRFGPADAVVALADAHGLRLRGHTLVWGGLQVPAYVAAAPGADALRALMAEHVATVVGRWAGRVAQWDVVNEPLPSITDAPTPDGLDDNVFRRLLGPGYVAEALRLARAADPGAKLFVNENGIEVPGPRQDRFFALVQELLAQGAPLDGVGFQAHVGLIPPAQYPGRATVEASLRRFAALGLDVELTELDVALVFRPGDVASRFARQGDDYRALVEACLAVPRCTGVTTWGLGDRLTWLRSFFGFQDWPLPFDDAWVRKPAYFGMRAGFLADGFRRG